MPRPASGQACDPLWRTAAGGDERRCRARCVQRVWLAAVMVRLGVGRQLPLPKATLPQDEQAAAVAARITSVPAVTVPNTA